MPKSLREKKIKLRSRNENFEIIQTSKYYFLVTLCSCKTRIFLRGVLIPRQWVRVSVSTPSSTQEEIGCDTCSFQHHSESNRNCFASRPRTLSIFTSANTLYSPLTRKPLAKVKLKNFVVLPKRKRGSAYLFVEKLYD